MKLPEISTRRRGAFTLAELLVVVGIIALLIAMLMPALANARRHALRTRCAAHLRQINDAFVMYANDYKGALPVYVLTPVPFRPFGYYWYEHLAPYVGLPDEFRAIAAAGDRSILNGCPVWYGGKSANFGYPGYGYNPLPHTPNQTFPFRNTPVMWIERNGGINGRYYKTWEIPDRHERGMVADAAFPIVITAPWLPGNPPNEPTYATLSLDRHGRIGDGATINILFFAGHVRAVSAKEAIYAFSDPRWTKQ